MTGSVKTVQTAQTVLTDEQIIDLYWQREERAIKETDNKYGRYLYRIAYNIVHDQCDSEECQNDTYLGVWNAVPPNRPLVFPAFLTQIMRRIAISRYREKMSKKRIPSELTLAMEDLTEILHDEVTVESELESIEIGRLISDYVKGLSDKQQYIFVARYYMAEPVSNIAKDLKINNSTVYKHLDKIKQGLKIFLENKGVSI